MEIVHYVYCTTNLINFKKYIGSHTGKVDDSYLGSGVNLVKALKKYGKENFSKTILWIGPAEFMREIETYWCEYFNTGTNHMFYNCTDKGTGYTYGRPNKKLSEYRKNNKIESFFKGKNKETNQSLKIISDKLKGKPSGMLGKKAWNKGKTGQGGWKFSDESREKLYWEREKIECEHCGKMIGKNNIKVHIRKNHIEGKIVDSSIGDKIRQKLQKFIYTAISEEEEIEASSCRELAEKINSDRFTVSKCIKTGRKTKSGYRITKRDL
jgi:hypothetical protein